MEESVQSNVVGPRFPLGWVEATPGAYEAMWAAGGGTALDLLARHQRGDWGEVSPGDAAENDLAVARGRRIRSVYTLNTGVTIWVVTEANRFKTTIMLPGE